MRDYAQLFSQKLTKSSILINNKISHPEIPEEKLKEYGEAAVGVDISQKEMNILVMLREVGKLTMTEVSREIGAKKPNTTRFVDKMIEKNLEQHTVEFDEKWMKKLTNYYSAVYSEASKIFVKELGEQVGVLYSWDGSEKFAEV